MSERVETVLVVTDKGSQTLQKVGQSAQKMGDQIDQAATKSAKSTDNLAKRQAALGAAFTSVQGVLSIASRAAAESEASQARLSTAIENTGHSLIEYEDQLNAAGEAAIQLGFDDEDAADAIAVLTTATGDAERAIEDLSLAEDIARARKISLSAATKIVVAAEQERFGALQKLGVQIEEGATKEEALDALRQQFAGNAEAYSQTQAAAMDRFQIAAGNALETLGAHLGPTQAILAILPGLSAGWTAAGAAVGALAPQLTAAAAASTLLNVAMGPVGIAALAIGAAVALYQFAGTVNEDVVPSMESAHEAGEALNDTFNNLIQTGSVKAPLAQNIKTDLDAITASVEEYNTAFTDATNEAKEWAIIPSGDPQTVEEYTEHQRHATEVLAGLETQQEKGRISSDELAAAQLAANNILKDTGPAADLAVDILGKLYAAEKAGTLATKEGESQWEAYLRQITELGDQLPGMNVGMIESATSIATVRTETELTTPAVRDLTTEIGILASTGQLMTDLEVTSWLADQFEAAQDVGAAADELHGHYGILEDDAASWGRAAEESAAQAAAAAQTDLEQMLMDQAGGYLHLADGITTASDAQALFKVTQDDIINNQSANEYGLSEYNDQLGKMQAAEDLLNQRREAGIPLTEKQLDYLGKVDDAQARLEGGTEDYTLALGEQALQYAENVKRGDEMNQGLKDNAEGIGTLDQTIRNLILALQGIPGYIPVNIDTNAQKAMNDVYTLNDVLAKMPKEYYISVYFSSIGQPSVPGYHPTSQLGGVIDAQGGTLSGSQVVRMNEPAGGELVRLPNGSLVYPHHASDAMIQTGPRGGGSTYIIHNMQVVANSPGQLADALRSHAREGSR